MSREICNDAFDSERLAAVRAAIEKDVASELYDGAVLCVGHSDGLVLHEAIGFADRANDIPMSKGAVFMSMSIGKQLVSALTLNRVERGDLKLTMPVCEVIPEFAARGKSRITLYQLLTMTSGLARYMPIGLDAHEQWNQKRMIAATCRTPPETPPGSGFTYSALVGHAVMAEMVCRVDGGRRTLREIMAQDLFEPLGMFETSLGAPDGLRERMCPIRVRDPRLWNGEGQFPPALLEASMDEANLSADMEQPAGMYLTTAEDFHRFAEMLRRGGELDGHRVLSPPMLRLVARNHTGDLTFPWEHWGWEDRPAAYGLGFMTRGDGVFPNHFGTLASPRAFGGLGLGSNAFWIDPEHDLSFVMLTTGLMEDANSVERFQRVSDLVTSSLRR